MWEKYGPQELFWSETHCFPGAELDLQIKREKSTVWLLIKSSFFSPAGGKKKFPCLWAFHVECFSPTSRNPLSHLLLVMDVSPVAPIPAGNHPQAFWVGSPWRAASRGNRVSFWLGWRLWERCRSRRATVSHSRRKGPAAPDDGASWLLSVQLGFH